MGTDWQTNWMTVWPTDQLTNWPTGLLIAKSLLDQPIYRSTNWRKEKGSKGNELINVANPVFSRFQFSLTFLATSRKLGTVGDWCWPYHGLWSTSVWWTLWHLFWTISLGSCIGSREHTGFCSKFILCLVPTDSNWYLTNKDLLSSTGRCVGPMVGVQDQGPIPVWVSGHTYCVALVSKTFYSYECLSYCWAISESQWMVRTTWQ